MNMLNRVAVIAAALSLASVASQAQVLNTGLGVGPVDANWTVTMSRISDGSVLYNGNAFFISPIPGVWQDNSTPTSNWIGASTTGSWQGGTSAIAYRYVFTTNLLGSGPIVGSMGWDNQFVGFSFNGGVTTSLYGNTPANFDEYGFCRTSDGEFNDKPQAACTRDFSIAYDDVQRESAGTFSVVIDGDLTTDGLLLRNASTTVPEPSTYALMAAGLAGIFGVSRRRRRNA